MLLVAAAVRVRGLTCVSPWVWVIHRARASAVMSDITKALCRRNVGHIPVCKSAWDSGEPMHHQSCVRQQHGKDVSLTAHFLDQLQLGQRRKTLR